MKAEFWWRIIVILAWVLIGVYGFAVQGMNTSPPRKVGQKGIYLIQQFEGIRLCAYLDPVGLKTRCWGHLDTPADTGLPDCMTMGQCYSLLVKDTSLTDKCLNAHLAPDIVGNKYDSLSSWVFNLGCGNLTRSQLLTVVNTEGSTSEEVGQELRKWVFAGGRKLTGLLLRREAERLLYGVE